jgi:4-amino-4-deoxy-L-arabinose transferase-like glycosyltransferase
VPTSVKAAQAVVGALGVLTIAAISLHLAGPGAGVAAALVAAVYPPLVWVASYAWSEAVAWPLGVLAVWLFDFAPKSPRRRESLIQIGTGLVVGLTILVRPGTLLFLAAATAWLGTRGRWQRAAWIVAGALAVLGPWSARNYLEYGRIMSVASEGGVTFWTGNHPLAIGDGDLSSNPALRNDQYRLKSQHPGQSDEQLESVYYREAFAWIREHPLDWLALEIRKAFYIVVPVGPSYAQHSTRYAVTSMASYLLILPFAAAGFRRLGAARGRAPGLWLLAGSSIVAALIFFPQERFRIPVVDPALIVCSSALFAPRTRMTSARADSRISPTG